MLKTLKIADVVEMSYMKTGFRIARVLKIDRQGVTMRRAYISHDGEAGFEDCYFTFADSRIDETWFRVTN